MKISIYALCLCFSLIGAVAANDTDAGKFQIKTTQDLYKACSWSKEDGFYARATAFCYGYILAALHYDAALNNLGEQERIFCPSETTSLLDVVDEFKAWSKTNPDRMQELPVEGVMRSANSKWSCKR